MPFTIQRWAVSSSLTELQKQHKEIMQRRDAARLAVDAPPIKPDVTPSAVELQPKQVAHPQAVVATQPISAGRGLAAVAFRRISKEVCLKSLLYPHISSQPNGPEQQTDGATNCFSTVATNHPPALSLLAEATQCLVLRHKSQSMRRLQRETVLSSLCAEVRQFWTALQEFQAKARLKALRDNDTDAYMEHMGMVKITSLLHIMEMTHAFMTRIGAQLEKQHRQSEGPTTLAATESTGKQQRLAPRTSSSVESSHDYMRFKEYVASSKDEYRLIHAAHVFVAAQPQGLNATLMPHQLVGLRFLASLFANNINGILADEMGVGKTIQTIAFLLYLKETLNVKGPHLILAPLSIVREWVEACQAFVPTSMKVVELEKLPMGSTPSDYDLIFLAVHRVRTARPELFSTKWNFVVVDEAHKAVSNLTTITAQAISSIPYQRRLVLTGTPLNSDLQELWSLLHFINPTIFNAKDSFDEVFRKPFQQAGADEKDAKAMLTDEERELLVMRMHQVLRPFMLRRTKKDIDDTLRISFHEIRCPLTFPQQHVLKMLREEKKVPQVIDGECRGSTILTIESVAQAVCNHSFMVPYFSQVLLRARDRRNRAVVAGTATSQLVDESPTNESEGTHAEAVVCDDPPIPTFTEEEQLEAQLTLACSGKFLVLDWILRRCRVAQVKAVLFTHWLDCIDLLCEYFHNQGWRDGIEFVVLSGSTSAEDRKRCVDTFRAEPRCLIFLVSVKAGGCGLNLQVAHLIFMLDRDYTGTNEDQAIARVFRIGQRNTVRAIHLVTNDPCEQKILEISDRKNKPRHAIIDGGGYHVEAVTEEERKKILAASMMKNAPEWIDLSSKSALDNCSPHLFDTLIAAEGGECEEGRNALMVLNGNTSETIRSGFFTTDIDQRPRGAEVILDSFDEISKPQPTYGKGKRSRDELCDDDFPPDSFWEKLVDDGFDDDEIKAIWKEKMQKQRAIAALCDVAFAMRTIEIPMSGSMKRMPKVITAQMSRRK